MCRICSSEYLPDLKRFVRQDRLAVCVHISSYVCQYHENTNLADRLVVSLNKWLKTPKNALLW